jgi:adenylate cyclase class 2
MAVPSSHEVEIKFRIADVDSLMTSLQAAGFHLATHRTHEINLLYDLPGNVLGARGQLLRLREYGDRWTLTFKDKSASGGRHKARREIETCLQNGPGMGQILECLGFRPKFSYEKYRSEWTDHHGHVVLDETPVGHFGEIEGDPDWIDQVARKLGISEQHYITASYSELFREWKRKTGSKAENMLFAETTSHAP